MIITKGELLKTRLDIDYKNAENRVQKEKSRQGVKRCEKIIEEDMDNELDDYVRMDKNNSERRSREENENDD